MGSSPVRPIILFLSYIGKNEAVIKISVCILITKKERPRRAALKEERKENEEILLSMSF